MRIKINELRNQVISILRAYPETRNSDITLMIKIWHSFYEDKLNGDSVKLQALYELPREDNIKRIRAKLQEEALERIKKGETDGNEQSFLPTDPKVAERRMIDRSIWEYVMGYRRVDNSNQSELFKN